MNQATTLGVDIRECADHGNLVIADYVQEAVMDLDLGEAIDAAALLLDKAGLVAGLRDLSEKLSAALDEKVALDNRRARSGRLAPRTTVQGEDPSLANDALLAGAHGSQEAHERVGPTQGASQKQQWSALSDDGAENCVEDRSGREVHVLGSARAAEVAAREPGVALDEREHWVGFGYTWGTRGYRWLKEGWAELPDEGFEIMDMLAWRDSTPEIDLPDWLWMTPEEVRAHLMRMARAGLVYSYEVEIGTRLWSLTELGATPYGGLAQIAGLRIHEVSNVVERLQLIQGRSGHSTCRVCGASGVDG
jgi:hypothetical protein